MKNRIKKLRQEMGLTQIELSNKMKVSQSTLSYWEKGTYDADNESLKKLADFFNCSVDYLICRSDIKFSVFDKDVFGETLTDREKQIILAYRKQPDMQASVCRLLGVEYTAPVAGLSEPLGNIGDDMRETIAKREATSVVTHTDIK